MATDVTCDNIKHSTPNNKKWYGFSSNKKTALNLGEPKGNNNCKTSIVCAGHWGAPCVALDGWTLQFACKVQYEGS